MEWTLTEENLQKMELYEENFQKEWNRTQEKLSEAK